MDIIKNYDHMVEYFEMKFSPAFRSIFAGVLLLVALLLWVFVILPIYHIPVS